MLEIKVYFYDVLRYTVIGDWDKVHELQNHGYSVYASPIVQNGSNKDASLKRNFSIGNIEYPDHHEYKYGLH